MYAAGRDCANQSRLRISEQVLLYYKHASNVTNFISMTALSLAQSEIFNRVRYKSERREEIARVIAAYHTESATKQSEIQTRTIENQKLFDGIAERQASVQKIADEIAKLSMEDATLQTDTMESLDRLDENGALKPMKIDFLDGKTICWNGKHIRLGGKPCKIVKVLYLAKRPVAVNRLGKMVWDDEALSHTTIAPTISKLNTVLEEANFPYKIKSVKRKQRNVPSRDLITGKVHVKKFRSTVVGYKLVPK
jgi:hypothetical protein